MVGLGGGGKQQGQQAGGGIGFARAGAAGDQGEPPPQGQGAGQFLPVAIGVFGGGAGLAGEQAIEPMADGGRINVGDGGGAGIFLILLMVIRQFIVILFDIYHLTR